MPYSPGKQLFSTHESRIVLEHEGQEIASTIGKLSEADIFGHPVEDLVDHILGIRELTPLRVNTNQLEMAEEGELKRKSL